ncbi:TrkA C-terminal domain-containing protein, partial [Bacillus sp. SIMBA_074]
PMSMKGKSLRELDLRAKYNISVIAIVSNGEIIIAPSPDQDIQEKDMLLVVGNKEDLAVFANIE